MGPSSQAKTTTALRFAEAIDDLEDLTIGRYSDASFHAQGVRNAGTP
jgi:hypothetical protein